MKKLLLILASAALLFTSCAKEELNNGAASGDNITLTVNAAVPGQAQTQTKAVWDNDGNGDVVDHWIMEVYDKENKLFTRQEKENQSGLTNTFTVTLIKNQSYKFVFWADTKDAYKTESLTALEAVGNVAGKDSRDAFYCMKEYTSNTNNDVLRAQLKRPFAQLNVVTIDTKTLYETMGNDTEYGKFIPKDIEVSMKSYKTFNALTDELSNEGDVLLTIAECYGNYAAHNEKTTIFMDYMFASKEEADVRDINCKFKSNGVEIVCPAFTNIPLQRNYRTNILGNLLSNDATWYVEILPQWNQPDYEVESWSAGMVTPIIPDAQGIYNVEKPSQLAWVAQMVNGTYDDGTKAVVAAETFKGKTIKLAADVDLNNGAWTPIGDANHPFMGTFDGNGKTIKKLSVVLGQTSNPAGLFGWIQEGTVKNFTIDGAKVSATTGAGVAVVAGKIFNAGTIEGVTVKNAELKANRRAGAMCGNSYGAIKNCVAENVNIELTPDAVAGGKYDNGDKAGVIVGFSALDNYSAISGNTVSNSTVKGYRDLGGIAGSAFASTVTGNSVTDVVITADMSIPYCEEKPANADIFAGLKSGDLGTGNTSENVKVVVIKNETEKALAEANEGDVVPIAATSDAPIDIPANMAKNVTITPSAASTVNRFNLENANVQGLVIKGVEGYEPALAAGASNSYLHADAKSAFSATIQDMTVNGDGVKNNWNTLVRIESCDDASLESEITIDGVTIDGSKYLVYAPGGSRPVKLTVKNCDIKNFTSWVVMANGSQFSEVVIDNCRIENCSGIVKLVMQKFTFTNNTLVGDNKEDHSASNKCIDYRGSNPQMTVSGNTSNGVNCDEAIIAKTF